MFLVESPGHIILTCDKNINGFQDLYCFGKNSAKHTNKSKSMVLTNVSVCANPSMEMSAMIRAHSLNLLK